jgi:ATP-dependent helicase/nuclease subunit B
MGRDAPRLILLPSGADLADAFAQDLVERCRAQLPDLTGVTVVLPAPAAAAHLRRRLARHAGRGLLGPHIHTLASLATQHLTEPPRSALECRLLLTEALRQRRGVFPGQDNGQVAEALFELFEEMTAARVDPGADEAAFARRLREAYGSPALELLSREAQIVHVLWQAFTADSGGRSPASAHVAGLRAAFAAATPAAPLMLVGFDSFTRAEGALAAGALADGRATLWLQGRTAGHDGEALRALLALLGADGADGADERAAPAGPRSALLDAAFDPAGSAAAATDPALALVEAGGAEHEARCVDLAVRKALLAGKADIVVLTQDRRLARRLRALLERAHVPLQDAGGWALSTSRAAAALDAWLECLEGRFRFRPLLDLLKSGFVDVDAAALDRLERTLVYREGVDGDLGEMLKKAQFAPLVALLKRLKDASFGVRADDSRAAQRWTASLQRSLEQAGLAERLAADEAGAQVLRVLRQLDAAFARVPLSLRWDELRSLVDNALERATFAPTPLRGGVRLLTLEQSLLARCDVLVLAGATREQLPGHAPRLPFFSAAVRAELGLPDWRAQRALALSRLRNALDGATQVVVTYAAGADDEPAQASPWIEAIEAQAQHSGLSLRDTQLPLEAADAASEVSAPGDPAQKSLRPAPPAPAALLPERLSATAHQALLDCPYKFFARSVLKLESEHAPDEDPDRSDYGKRVHKILEAFLQPVTDPPGLPPPFPERITAASRERAQSRLTEIADAVFAPDLAHRAMALTWKAEFRAAIPELLDWMSSRTLLREVHAEVRLERAVEGVQLYGIVDRLETRGDGSRVVVDYKTGRKLPPEADIRAGEAVQLLHYALLDDGVKAIEYRQLRKDSDSLALEEGLPELRAQVRDRLAAAVRAMRGGAPLPAQGDEKACEHCDYGGLCRRQDWHD